METPGCKMFHLTYKFLRRSRTKEEEEKEEEEEKKKSGTYISFHNFFWEHFLA
jgi:hypothetical protein